MWSECECATVGAIEDLKKFNFGSVSVADVNNVITKLTDILAFQGCIFLKMNAIRRKNIRPHLKPEFSSLFSEKIESEDGILFGSDLVKSVLLPRKQPG